MTRPPRDAAELLETSPHAVLVTDRAGVVEWANAAARDLLELVPSATVLDAVDPVDRGRAGDLLALVADGARGGPAYLRLRDEVRWLAVRAAPAGPDRVQLAVADVTDAARDRARLRHVAQHDVLTDLPARALVLSRLQQAVEDEALVGVLFVDLDGFKLVNDALGHAAGDAVLVQAARRLGRLLRSGDTVGRWGGDEFVVVLPGLPHPERGLEVARRLEEALAQPFPVATDEVLVSASVGVAFCSRGADPEEVLREADAAMYRAKSLGKRRYEVFDAAMRERAEQRATVEQLLRRVVQDGRVVVHYQPVVDLVSRKAIGVEALARVQDHELLTPDAFLDVALEAGLLPAVDAAVLETACAEVAGWRERLGVDLELAVNVTASRLDDALPPLVDKALTSSGLPADRLVLELTEQALVASGPRAERVLRELVAAGVRVSLDDFGTGWASLTYLRRFPVSNVKVDRSFVAGMTREADDRTIVAAVIDLAQQLGLTCTAEGVETEEQYGLLRDMAPPFGQGWLFGRAVPSEQVPELLARIGTVPVDVSVAEHGPAAQDG